MKFVNFLIIISLFCGSAAGQGWVLENPYPTYQHLYSVDFTSQQTGYLAGDYGTLLKTSNGGMSWNQVNIPASFYNSQIRHVNFLNDDLGFICHGTQVFKTTNGGETWTSSATGLPGTLQGTYFSDQNNGFAFGCYESLAKTTDGGASWNTIMASDANDLYFSYIDFAGTTGFCVAQDWFYNEAVLYKSINSGNSWNRITVPDEINYISGLEVLSAAELWIGAGNTIWTPQSGYQSYAYHSTDGGATWTSHLLGSTNSNAGAVLDIKFFNQSEGRIVNLNHIYSTHDGGNTWTDRNVSANVNIAANAAVSWINQSTCYIAGFSPSLIKTNDSGETTVDLISGGTPQFETTYFINGQFGLVGGSHNSKSIIRYSNNGGSNWTNAGGSELNGQKIYDIVFTNEMEGYAFYADGILKSTDGGLTWINNPAEFHLPFIKAVVVNGSIIYVSGSGGQLFKSNNGGETFIQIRQAVADFDKVSGLQFTDALTGYLAIRPVNSSSPGKFFKTVNGGESWTEISYGQQQEILSISFINSSTGIISLQDKKLLRTTNGGLNWSQVEINPPFAITYVRLFNESKAVAAIKGQYLYHSDDGGISFDQVYAGATIWPYSSSNVCFKDQNHGWASGSQGMIMRYDATFTAISTPDWSNSSAEEEIQFFYPNPAKETIRVIESGTLWVYSLSGELIMMQNANAGDTFDVSKLDSGIYMISLSTATKNHVSRLIKVN